MSLKNTITKFVSRSVLQGKKFSPEILIGAGVVGVVATAVLASRATLSIEREIRDSEDEFDELMRVRDERDEVEYTSFQFERDRMVLKARFVASIARLYLPTAIVGVASIACLLGSHKILKTRNVALVAAYKLLDTSFENYRDRVINELGEDKDREFRYDIENHDRVFEEVQKDDPQMVHGDIVPKGLERGEVSVYARWFAHGNPEWSDNREYNLIFLQTVQARANEQLTRKGHVFLNEVYDMLNVPRTSTGQLVGWVTGRPGVDDDFVDFGIHAPHNEDSIRNNRFLLDFNVSGVVYDMI